MWIKPESAIATPCWQMNSHTICLVDVKRSAKQFWEYRAIVSVDGVEKPREIYNCRDRQRVQADGRTLPFTIDDAGDLICRKLYHPVRSPVR